jgi:hypothetical protein
MSRWLSFLAVVILGLMVSGCRVPWGFREGAERLEDTADGRKRYVGLRTGVVYTEAKPDE